MQARRHSAVNCGHLVHSSFPVSLVPSVLHSSHPTSQAESFEQSFRALGRIDSVIAPRLAICHRVANHSFCSFDPSTSRHLLTIKLMRFRTTQSAVRLVPAKIHVQHKDHAEAPLRFILCSEDRGLLDVVVYTPGLRTFHLRTP